MAKKVAIAQKLRLRIKSYDHKLIDSSAHRIMLQRFAIREGGHTVGAGVVTKISK